jgi:glyoxylase-like metal-dependent hydrolase (beta-lactamase superfamily II)
MFPIALLFALLAADPAPRVNADGTTTVVPATGPGVFDYELRRVAEGVYVAVRPDVFRQPVDGNVVLIVNEADVVAVDSGGTVASAEGVIRLLRAVTNKPVRYVLNTHWHGDHNLGNQVFVREFPGVEIVAHPATAAGMTRDNIGFDRFLPQMTEFLEELRQGVATGKDKEGQAIAPDRIVRWKALIPDIEAGVAELRRAKIVLPTLTFADPLVLRRGEREIHVRWVGKGNTEGDAVVWLPRERILVSGDLVVHPQPYGFGSFPAEWRDTLDKLVALDYAVLVPGHGEVQRDTAYLRNLQRLIETVRTQVAMAVKDGATLEQARERLSIGPELEQAFTAGDARRKTLLKAWFLDPFSLSAYKEAKGEPIVQGQQG